MAERGYKEDVEVTNFASVISALQSLEVAVRRLEEVIVELKKIRLGVGLTTGTDLAEEEVE